MPKKKKRQKCDTYWNEIEWCVQNDEFNERKLGGLGEFWEREGKSFMYFKRRRSLK